MITRFRIEAEGSDKEEVEWDIEEASQVFLTNPLLHGVDWERTDEVGPMPIAAENGDPVFYMRRVFKRTSNER